VGQTENGTADGREQIDVVQVFVRTLRRGCGAETPTSQEVSAAIDRERNTGDERGIVRGKKHCRASNIICGGEPTERMLRDQRVAKRGGIVDARQVFICHRGIYCPRKNGIYAYACRSKFCSERACHRHDAPLCGGIRRQIYIASDCMIDALFTIEPPP